MAERTGLSLRTINYLELGQPVKLGTLRKLAEACGVKNAEWLDLIVSWLRQEAGDDSQSVWIEPKDTTSALKDGEESQVAKAMQLFSQLNPHDRQEIIRAMERPEVRACLPSINRVWEKFDQG